MKWISGQIASSIERVTVNRRKIHLYRTTIHVENFVY